MLWVTYAVKIAYLGGTSFYGKQISEQELGLYTIISEGFFTKDSCVPSAQVICSI